MGWYPAAINNTLIYCISVLRPHDIVNYRHIINCPEYKTTKGKICTLVRATFRSLKGQVIKYNEWQNNKNNNECLMHPL